MARNQTWSDEDDAMLLANKHLPTKQLMELLDRSADAINWRRRILGHPAPIHALEPPYTFEEECYVADHWREETDAEMAYAIGRSASSVQKYRLRNGWRRHVRRGVQDTNAYLPSQEEIAAACAEIRSKWSPQEERKRREWALSPVSEVRRSRTTGRVGRLGLALEIVVE